MKIAFISIIHVIILFSCLIYYFFMFHVYICYLILLTECQWVNTNLMINQSKYQSESKSLNQKVNCTDSILIILPSTSVEHFFFEASLIIFRIMTSSTWRMVLSFGSPRISQCFVISHTVHVFAPSHSQIINLLVLRKCSHNY